MQKIVTLIFLSFFSISMAKNVSKMHELVDLIKKHPVSIEREKAIQDLKYAGIAGVATIAGGIALYIVKDIWEDPKINRRYINGHLKVTQSAAESLPLWISIPWVLVEVAGIVYVFAKGFQGAKHLFSPDHKIDGPNAHEMGAKKLPTHVRVKREHA